MPPPPMRARRMTVMFDTMRSAKGKPEKKTAVFDDAFTAEKCPNKRLVIKLASSFLYTSDSLDEKVTLLAQIGNIAFTGGPEVALFAAQLLPYLFVLFEDRTTPRSLVMEILWAFCQMCYQSPKVVDHIRGRSATMRRLVSLVCDTHHVTDSRAACYLLTIMVANSTGVLFDLISKKYPELQHGLLLASHVSQPWTGWGCNQARRLSLILGWGVVTAQTQQKGNTDSWPVFATSSSSSSNRSPNLPRV